MAHDDHQFFSNFDISFLTTRIEKILNFYQNLISRSRDMAISRELSFFSSRGGGGGGEAGGNGGIE